METSRVTLKRIEETVIQVLKSLSKNYSPSLTRPNLALKGRGKMSAVEWGYRRQRRKFLIMFQLMDQVHYLILNRQIRTKRDLYYENVCMYGEQSCLDIMVKELGDMLRVPRPLLHIEATAKGLVAGNLSWTSPDNETITTSQTTGMLIPANIYNHHSFESQANFILLVEKDAIFQKLLNDKIFKTLGNFILVTGKGYPDFATRVLIRKLGRDLSLQTFALMDNDPHGIEIAAIYKWGTNEELRKVAYDMTFVSEFTIPNLIWLGILPSEMGATVAIAKSSPLTDSDRKKIGKIEQRLHLQEGSRDWMEELEQMKTDGIKAELEALETKFFVHTYLKSKVRDFIAFDKVDRIVSKR